MRARKMPFNGLTNAQAELLAMLAEEAGEVVQAAMKILRHGYRSHAPGFEGQTSNRADLIREIADLLAVLRMLENAGDITIPTSNIVTRAELRKRRYTHHQEADQ